MKLSDTLALLQQYKYKGIVVIDNIDAEIAKLLEVDRSSVTKWRTGSRFPKFDDVVEYEEKLGLPFECFISRDPNLEAIKDKLEAQLKAVKKAIKEREENDRT